MYTMTLASRLSRLTALLLLSGCATYQYPDMPPKKPDCAEWQKLADHLQRNAPPGNVDPEKARRWLAAEAAKDGCALRWSRASP